MKKIDWKIRFRNKVFVISISSAVITFVYQILGIIGIVPAISEDSVNQMIAIVLNLLVGLGILIDPSTPGIQDHNYGSSDSVNGFDEESEPEVK